MLKWRRKKETMAKIKNNFRLLLIFIMLILGLGLINTHPVSAVSSIPVDLETGYIYTYYDVTGDGRKDNFKEVYLKDLISEAKKLGITKKELIDMKSDIMEE